MIVDEPYTVNEKYGLKDYEVGVFYPDFNGFITLWSAKCKVTNLKKIAKLRQHAIDYARINKEKDSREWKKVSV